MTHEEHPVEATCYSGEAPDADPGAAADGRGVISFCEFMAQRAPPLMSEVLRRQERKRFGVSFVVLLGLIPFP